MLPTWVLALSLALPAAADDLAGTWLKDGAPYAQLRADGTGTVDGTPVAWKADGRTLTLISEDGDYDRLPYALQGDALRIAVEGTPSVLTRAGGKAAKAVAAPARAKGQAQGLAALLLSSPWCHFSYNKVSGRSSQERVVFRADGTWDSGSRRETYSSGVHGTVAGQSDRSSGGRWKVQGSRLLLSEGAGALEDASLKISKNSNGHPILNADGKEYSQCR